VIALAFGVYLAKTNAGRERAKIATIERQIAEEQRKLKLLRAEVAHLEQPERLEQLSTQHLGLQAVDGSKEAMAEALARHRQPAEKGAVNAVPMLPAPVAAAAQAAPPATPVAVAPALPQASAPQ
jgi:cell division protein FtsL